MMTKATNARKQIWDEDPVLLGIVLISITVTLIGDFIKCLLQIHLPKQKQLVAGSVGTTGQPSLKTKNQLRSHSTNAPCITVDQKKADGITNQAGPSEQSVSSPRSKPSAKQSHSKSTHSKRTATKRTTLDGPNGVLASPTSTPKRTPKNVRTTADVKSIGSAQA